MVSAVKDLNLFANHVAWAMQAIGYSDKLVFRYSIWFYLHKRIKSGLPKALHIIKIHKPRTQLPLPSGLEEITIRVPGPIDRSYRLVNQAIPPAMKSAATPSFSLPTAGKACITAKMELFHDEAKRNRLIVKTYSRLRAVDPKIKPWELGQKMTDVKPQRPASQPFPTEALHRGVLVHRLR